MEDILVLGVGNILQRDDGVGVRVIEHLQGAELPPCVEVFDGGTAALDLLSVVANRQRLIVVDAVQGGSEAGAIYCFTPDDVETEPHPITSVHQIGLLETLAMARHLGCSPKSIVIFGVEPKVIDWGLDLSPEVAAVVPDLARLVLEEACRPISSGKDG
ncbi:MAG: HyaD/HybD family hydrogenase maturation endopeptidase [Dehalococcoidales bacterium]|nr:HyaD/HybD family hydrogenase maturation endopeptidase [Dehalococcoidales bacterium]